MGDRSAPPEDVWPLVAGAGAPGARASHRAARGVPTSSSFVVKEHVLLSKRLTWR